MSISDLRQTHPLLAQIPLTVSPFLSLPSAVTLPYTYKSAPTSLPPSLLADAGDGSKPKYVVSASGHSASPDDIIASCNALQKHVQDNAEASEKTIRDWEDGIKQKELAEKRRVAPGWLDRDEKILEPVKAKDDAKKGASLLDSGDADDQAASQMPAIQAVCEGEELDRAFGRLGLK
jgi:hypothetical protein